MKLHYRIINDEVEIVRCFGADPALELPEEINGRPVKRMAPYAFSARKDREDEDVLVFTTDEERMFRDEERLLAGEVLESVRLECTAAGYDGRSGTLSFLRLQKLKRASFLRQAEKHRERRIYRMPQPVGAACAAAGRRPLLCA